MAGHGEGSPALSSSGPAGRAEVTPRTACGCSSAWLLGSLAEAEDAVQETYARWYAMSRQGQDAIASPGGGRPRPRPPARGCLDFAARSPGLTILERTVNGQPGLVAQRDGVTVAVAAFDIAADRVKHLWIVLNPEKLRAWTGGEGEAEG